MADIYRNIALDILPANSTNDVLLYTPDTGKSGLVNMLRAAVHVTTFATGTTPRIASLKLQTPGNPGLITVRQFAIPPQQTLGAFLDLLAQFSPTQAYGFAPGAALYLQLNTALSAGNRITIFGVAAEG